MAEVAMTQRTVSCGYDPDTCACAGCRHLHCVLRAEFGV
jgi:hypothetical protein